MAVMSARMTNTEQSIADFDSASWALTGIATHYYRETEEVRRARRSWRAFRAAHGYRGDAPLLTPPGSQPKLGKSATPSWGLMLTPAIGVGTGANLCPAATKGCAAACLATAGKGRMSSVQRARQVRTLFLLTEPRHFAILLGYEILRAARSGPINVRLNTVSDIRWELVAPNWLREVQQLAPTAVHFYDYTAWTPHARAGAAHAGIHLTYSRKDRGAMSREETLSAIMHSGGNVSVVFDTARGADLPATWLGFPVIDGDVTDDRTLDPPGHVVGLRAKGDARGDASGFVVSGGDAA